MNASDVVNAIGSSPGTVGQLTGTGSTTYTPMTNVLLSITGTPPSSGTLTINGIQVIQGASGITNAQVSIPVAKGQLTTITSTTGATCLISARSIQ